LTVIAVEELRELCELLVAISNSLEIINIWNICDVYDPSYVTIEGGFLHSISGHRDFQCGCTEGEFQLRTSYLCMENIAKWWWSGMPTCQGTTRYYNIENIEIVQPSRWNWGCHGCS